MGKAKLDEMPGEAVAVPEEAPAPVPKIVPAIAPALDEPNSTVRTFCSGSLHDPITKAFISCEERVHGTRKLTDAQWAQLLQEFKSAPRG